MKADDKKSKSSKGSEKKYAKNIQIMDSVNPFMDIGGMAMTTELTGMMSVPAEDDEEYEAYMDLLKKD